jgi:hypothetical protein
MSSSPPSLQLCSGWPARLSNFLFGLCLLTSNYTLSIVIRHKTNALLILNIQVKNESLHVNPLI